MVHMNKAVNGYLITLIIILTLTVIGTVYYNNQRYGDQAAELAERTATISELRQENARLLATRGEGYAELQAEYLQLQGENGKLRQNILDTQATLTKCSDEKRQANMQLQAAANDLVRLRDEYDELRAGYNDCRSDLAACHAGG